METINETPPQAAAPELTKEHKNHSESKFKKLLHGANSRKIVIILALVLVGAGIVIFSHAATTGMGSDCLGPRTEVVNRQQLWCDTHAAHEGGLWPYAPLVHGQRSSSYYTYFTPVNGGAHQPPANGVLPASGSDSVTSGAPNSQMESIHSWLELTSDSTSYVNADVEVRKQSMNLAFHMKSTNKWVTKANTNAAINCQNTGFGYSGTGGLTYGTGPSGGPLLGWNIGGQFMKQITDDSGTNGRSRQHCGEWSQQPSTAYDDVDAVVAWGVFRTVGPDAAKAAYRLEVGVDRRNVNSPSNIPSYPGRLRKVTPEWQTFTMSTMSDTLLDKPGYADALSGIIPGYTTSVTNQAPTVTSFVSTPAGTTTGQNYTISANATDSDGSVSKIEIFQAGVSKQVCTNVTTCSFTTSSATTGTVSYNAVVTDNSGATATSSTINVIIGTATTASLTNGTYNDTDSSIVYSSGWTAATGGSTYLANEHYSNTPGSTATIKFSGEQLTLISHGNTDMGQATITVDGVAQTPVGEWYNSSSLQPKTNWVSAKFSKTTVHTAVITVNSTKNAASAGNYVSIDKIVVADAPVVSLTPGLNGQYFNNTTFTGTPTLSRIDSYISNPWVSTGSPAGSINVDNFSARWTGMVTAPVTGSYKFHTWSDDAVQVWINGVLVISDTTWHGATYDTSASTVALTAGVPVSVKIEYVEGTQASYIEFKWTGPTGSGITDQVVPASALSH